MRRHLLASAAVAGVLPVAFINTNAGSKLYICNAPQDSDLAAADFAALTWKQVGGVGSHGQTGVSTNILSYTTWDTDIVQKGKGTSDAGSPVIEVARDMSDVGQDVLRAACLTTHSYAFKVVRNDALTQGGTPTIRYNRGIVTGPMHPNGKNEDFDLEMFTLGLNQREISVDPT